jgi:plastocyanin
MAEHTIEVGNGFFNPRGLIVSPGDTVIFKSVGGLHSIMTDQIEGGITVTPLPPPSGEDTDEPGIAIPAWSSERSVLIGGTAGTWSFVCGEHPTQPGAKVSIEADV